MQGCCSAPTCLKGALSKLKCRMLFLRQQFHETKFTAIVADECGRAVRAKETGEIPALPPLPPDPVEGSHIVSSSSMIPSRSGAPVRSSSLKRLVLAMTMLLLWCW